MNTGTGLASISSYIGSLRGRISGTASSMSELLRHSAILRDWARCSWPAWAVLAGLGALGVRAAPSAAQTLADWLFPEVSREHLFGIITTRESDPRNATAYRVAMGAYWVLFTGVAVVLLDRTAKPTLEAARLRARELLVEARALLEHNPERSIALLDQAMALPAERDVQQALLAERQGAAQRLSGSGQGTVAMAEASATVRMEPGEWAADDGGRYVVETELGRGAMGVVYRGRDTLLDRPVALKALPESIAATADLAGRFRQEAKAAARLTHAGIVQVHDFVSSSRGNFIVLELVEGQPLDRYLRDHAPMAVDQALALAVPLAEALGAAHGHGITHRDFKPGNVLLTRDGQPKITDFGLAKVTGSSMATVVGSVLGSPGYMSPEQAAGESADHRSDMYAFGVVLYHMLTGAPPFQGDTASVLSQHITAEPRPLDGLRQDAPKALAEVMARLLAKAPGHRFESMEAVAARLRTIATEPTAGPPDNHE